MKNTFIKQILLKHKLSEQVEDTINHQQQTAPNNIHHPNHFFRLQ